MTRCESVRLEPDPRRVITKPFLPREEIYADGSTRMQALLQRIMDMSDDDVDETLHDARTLFASTPCSIGASTSSPSTSTGPASDGRCSLTIGAT